MEEKEVKTGEKPKSTWKSCCIVLVVLFVIVVIIIFAKVIFSTLSSNADSPVPSRSPSSASKSTAKPTLTPISTLTDEQILNYFIDVTTYNGTMTQRKNLCRWTMNPITVEIRGDVNQKTIAALDAAINEFNAVSDTKMKRSESGAMAVYYLPIEQFPETGNENYKGISFIDPDGNCVISSGKFYVDDTAFEDTPSLSYYDALLLVTRHEMFHNLGFQGHDVDKDRGCNTLSNIACLIREYTEYDTATVKMLYNSGVPLCADEVEIREYFSTHKIPR